MASATITRRHESFDVICAGEPLWRAARDRRGFAAADAGLLNVTKMLARARVRVGLATVLEDDRLGRTSLAAIAAMGLDVGGVKLASPVAHLVVVDAAGGQSGVLSDAAAGAAELEIPLLHISTDYVFDGVAPRDAEGRPRPYVESDPTDPCSVYGQTKLEGERAVLAASPRHTVVRTAWLYGVDGRNFVDTMLRLAEEREAVQVVDDQIGSPTWSGHLAPAVLGLLERQVQGLVHLTGSGRVSWNGFAREIFRQAEVSCRVESATSEQMARPAPRPAWSALESERDDILPMPSWEDGLAGYLAARNGMMRP